MKRNLRWLALSASISLAACSSSGSSRIGNVQNGLGSVQNGIGNVQNGLGPIAVEDMGTVVFDAAQEGLQHFSISGAGQHSGSRGGSVEVVKIEDSNLSVTRTLASNSNLDLPSGTYRLEFKDFEFRKGYPVLTSGQLIAQVLDSGDQIKAVIRSPSLQFGQQTLSIDMKYDLRSQEEDESLFGRMVGRLKADRDPVNVDRFYDTPILLRMDVNQEVLEPGQVLQLRATVASSSAMDRMFFGLKTPYGISMKELESRSVETKFTEIEPGLWQAIFTSTIQKDSPEGDYELNNIFVINKSRIRSNQWPNIKIKIVRLGSGAEARGLPEIPGLSN